MISDAHVPRQDARRWRRVWGLVFLAMLLVIAWAGWRSYDYRGAVREIEKLEDGSRLSWESRDPLELIRRDWRRAFRRTTWKDTSSLTIESPHQLASLAPLIHRLNPRYIMVWDAGNLTPLQGLSNLEQLEIRGTKVRNLEGLKKLPRLEKLTIHECPELEDLRGVRELRALKTLAISSCNGVKDWREIGELPELETLRIMGCALQELPGLRGLPLLRHVRIQDCAQLRNLAGLGAVPGLRWLEIYGCGALKNLEGLAGLGTLQELRVSSCRELASLDGLAGAPNLQSLMMEACDQVQDFEGLRGVPNLRVLHLSDAAITDLDVIRGATQLRELSLAGCKNLVDFTVIRKLPHLESVDILYCAHFTDAVFGELSAALPGVRIEPPRNPEE